MAYIGNQFRHRKIEVRTPAINMLVVGSAPMLDEVRALLDRHHPGGRHHYIEGNSASLPQGHLTYEGDLAAYDMVVYDANDYSYATMLQLLADTPGNTLRLATYSVRTGVLLTDKKIYKQL